MFLISTNNAIHNILNLKLTKGKKNYLIQSHTDFTEAEVQHNHKAIHKTQSPFFLSFLTKDDELICMYS
jgi:hypothetical protein